MLVNTGDVRGVIMGLLYTDNTNLHHRLNVLEGEMLVIRDLISQVRPVRYYRLLQSTVYRLQSDGMTIN